MGRVVVDGSLASGNHNHRANAKEWRLFMSSKVSDTLSNVAPQDYVNMDDEEKLQRKEFDKIFKEVEQLGTSQMSWKRRKELETQRRNSLGTKAEKGHRMPIEMGRNIKRKREKFEEQRRQEDIAIGFRRSKREKKTAERPNAENRGLKVSEGIFRGGVLYVKPLTTKREEVQSLTGKGGKLKGKPHKKGKKGKKFKGKRKRR